MEQWIKSSYSRGNGGNCVECRTDQDRVLVRDTQHRALGHLTLPVREWTALLHALRRGDLG